MRHSFEISVAVEYGINAAILLDDIGHFVRKLRYLCGNTLYNSYLRDFNAVYKPIHVEDFRTGKVCKQHTECNRE